MVESLRWARPRQPRGQSRCRAVVQREGDAVGAARASAGDGRAAGRSCPRARREPESPELEKPSTPSRRKPSAPAAFEQGRARRASFGALVRPAAAQLEADGAAEGGGRPPGPKTAAAWVTAVHVRRGADAGCSASALAAAESAAPTACGRQQCRRRAARVWAWRHLRRLPGLARELARSRHWLSVKRRLGHPRPGPASASAGRPLP